jgi:hypothetical protein
MRCVPLEDPVSGGDNLKRPWVKWTDLSNLSQLKAISSNISAWKTPIITFSEHSKPHPRSPNPDTLYVAMHIFLTHKTNFPILPPQKRKFLSIIIYWVFKTPHQVVFDIKPPVDLAS